MILAAAKSALKELGIPKENTVIVGGIWCSSKVPHYIDGYAAETLHGRTLPFATWVKLANPDLTVIAMWWDGDGYGIWLSHFLHTCRRNINLTYIVFDNENYGLTTWQSSPTTPVGAKTKYTPDGNTLSPLNPLALATAWWCQFTRETNSASLNEMKEIMKEAIQFEWFSHINVKSACPSWKRW